MEPIDPLFEQKKTIAFLMFNQMTIDDFVKFPEGIVVPHLAAYISSPEFNDKVNNIQKLKHKAENYAMIVNSFISLCASSVCDNRKLTKIMQTGIIRIAGKKYALPDINPFEYMSMINQPENWTKLSENRQENLANIANHLDGNTVDNKSAQLGIITAIHDCLAYYYGLTEIAYLIYACGLASMLLWSDFYYFPLKKLWGMEDEYLNHNIPLKSLQKWSFLNIVIKTITKPTSIADLGTVYKASAYDLYTMSYYTADSLSANCLMLSLLETTYLQDFVKLPPSKLFIAMQAPIIHKTEGYVQYKSTLSLGDAGTLTTHWGSTYQNPEGAMVDMRIGGAEHGYVCVKDRLPYKGNALYIAKSALYTIISSYKDILRKNHDRFTTLNLISEYKFLFSRACYLFYNLRIILESLNEPSPLKEIMRDLIIKAYRDDLTREALVSSWKIY